MHQDEPAYPCRRQIECGCAAQAADASNERRGSPKPLLMVGCKTLEHQLPAITLLSRMVQIPVHDYIDSLYSSPIRAMSTSSSMSLSSPRIPQASARHCLQWVICLMNGLHFSRILLISACEGLVMCANSAWGISGRMFMMSAPSVTARSAISGIS